MLEMILRNGLPRGYKWVLLKLKQKFLMNMHFFPRYLKHFLKILEIFGSNFPKINNWWGNGGDGGGDEGGDDYSGLESSQVLVVCPETR